MERDEVGKAGGTNMSKAQWHCTYENIMVTPTMLTKIVNFKGDFKRTTAQLPLVPWKVHSWRSHGACLEPRQAVLPGKPWAVAQLRSETACCPARRCPCFLLPSQRVAGYQILLGPQAKATNSVKYDKSEVGDAELQPTHSATEGSWRLLGVPGAAAKVQTQQPTLTLLKIQWNYASLFVHFLFLFFFFEVKVI